MKKSPLAIALASALSLSFAALAQGDLSPNMPPPGSTEDRSFLDLDKDVDGKLTEQEASQSPVLKDKFTTADSNQDGSLDVSEFSAFVATSGDSAVPSGSGDMGAAPTDSGQVSFDTLDANKDQWLSSSEAAQHPTLSQDYNIADKDRDGYISQSEFSAFESQPVAEPPKVSFEMLDENKDGSLSQDEARLHPIMSQQYSVVDTDKDGMISESEFSAFEDKPSGAASEPVSFESLDMNRDGTLSQDEAQAHPSLSLEYSTVDQDKDGYISQSEFSAFEGKPSAPSGGASGASGSSGAAAGQPMSFDQLDTNKDGWLSKQEYQASMGAGGTTKSPAVKTSSFQTLDVNKDGSISKNEASADPNVTQQFTQIDKDQNGFISQSEFSAFETSQSMPGGSGGASGGTMQ